MALASLDGRPYTLALADKGLWAEPAPAGKIRKNHKTGILVQTLVSSAAVIFIVLFVLTAINVLVPCHASARCLTHALK